MNKDIIPRNLLGSNTRPRLEKLRQEITDILFERGHTINLPLIEDIAEIIYVKEDRAFYLKDAGEL